MQLIYFVIFTSSILTMTPVLGETSSIIYIGSLLILLIKVNAKYNFIYKRITMLILLLLLCLFSISFINHPSTYGIVNILKLLLLITIPFSLWGKALNQEKQMIDIYKAAWVSVIIISIASLISIFTNQILFSNTNGLGSFAAISIIISLLFNNIISSRALYFMNTSNLIISGFLLITSSSRTSFIVVIVAIIIYLFSTIWKKRYSLRISMLRLFVSFILIFVGLFYFEKAIHLINEKIVSKFVRKSQENDLLDQRTSFWDTALQDINLWGNGDLYFITNFGTSSHNSFIHLLISYGWLIFVLLSLLMIYSLIKIFLTPNNKKIFIILPLIHFTLGSLTENILYGLSMTLSILLLPIMLSKDGDNFEKYKSN
ncbi:O-antigen ligase family protein [Bhargavaea ginsengi]|uniref:O-antigen ligase family protein n=1 Tax=Bhargavaea ginsengi TaxID=426757 RepID=UPI003C73B63C